MFQEIKNRDAWSTIRGFVYQVDITLLRWLNLHDNEILELERGEDIDIIARDILTKQSSRELEQVKYRESNVTLNQDAVLDMLLNFFRHKQKNPDQRIIFRFVTNANFGIERPSLFTDGRSGIESWIRLANKKEDENDGENFSIIQSHLIKKCEDRIATFTNSNAAQPELQQWKDFNAFLTITDNLYDFIRDFDWSLGNPDADSIDRAVKQKIASLGMLADIALVDHVYSRLFLHTFKLLTSSQLKQLRRSQLLGHLTMPKLSTSDGAMLMLLNGLFGELQQRVSVLESKVNEHTTQLNTLFNKTAKLEKVDAVFEYRLETLPIQAPALIQNGSVRAEKVSQLRSIHAEHPWLALQGINGTGKSQLAALMCEQTFYYWLDLRPYHDNMLKSNAALEVFLSTISKTPVSKDRKKWAQTVVQKLQAGTLLAINDVPRLERDEPLTELLIFLVNAIQASAVRLLTTSNFTVPQNVRESLSAGVFTEYYDFEFSNEEIEEFLQNKEAPEYVVRYAKVIASVSQRNPRLVSAIISRLKGSGWGPDSSEVFDELFSKELTAETLADAQRSIGKIIQHPDSRELLYRMSLFNWDFPFSIVQAIANVEASIQHPNERLGELLNIWVQEQRSRHYQISPIIYKLGEHNLSEQTVQAVHFSVAEAILSTKEIDVLSAARSITSFLAAKAIDRAGHVLMNVYLSAKNPEEAKVLKEWGYLAYWKEIDTPQNMNTLLKAYLRNEQIRISRLLNIDSSVYEKWLSIYVDTCEDPSEKVLLRILLLNHFDARDITKYLNNFDETVRHWNDLEAPYAGLMNGQHFMPLLWLPVQHFSTKVQVAQWLHTIDLAERIFGGAFFDDPISPSAMLIIGGSFVQLQKDKPAGAQRWSEVSDVLTLLQSYFKNRKLEALEAAVFKEIINLVIHVDKDIEKGKRLTEEKARLFTEPAAKYFLFENIGKALFRAKQEAEAQVWLERAVEQGYSDATNYIETLLFLAAADTDPKSAVVRCEEIVKRVNTDSDSGLWLPLQVEGELAVAYWRNNQPDKSFEHFEKIVTDLFALKDKYFGDDWKRLIQWTGHSLGYIAAAVSNYRIPEWISTGEEYIKPYVGIYSLTTRDVTHLYKALNEPAMFSLMADFAAALELLEKAYQWTQRAFDSARKNKDQQMLSSISQVGGQYPLVNFKVAETFELYLTSAATVSHLGGQVENKFEQLAQVDLAELLKKKPSEAWNTAESTALTFGIIPLFMIVLNGFLENREDKDARAKLLLKELSDYEKRASDKDLWTTVIFLFNGIVFRKLDFDALLQMAARFEKEDRQNLRAVCLIGCAFLSRKPENTLIELLNIFQAYLTTPSLSITRSVYVPFVRSRCKTALKELFVGTLVELQIKLSTIDAIQTADKHAIQKILRIAIADSSLTPPSFMMEFLYPKDENSGRSGGIT